MDVLLTAVFALVALAALFGWARFVYDMAQLGKTNSDTLANVIRVNDHLNARVGERVRILNRTAPPLPGEPISPEEAKMRTTAILDEAHEIERELRRPRNPRTEWNKRDSEPLDLEPPQEV